MIERSRGRWIPAGENGFELATMDFAIDPPVAETRTDAYVCVRNLGRRPIVLTGVFTKFGNTCSTGAGSSTSR